MTPADDIALSGIAAATLKLSTSAANLVNAGDQAPVGGRIYQPRTVVQAPAPGGGVTATAVTLKSASIIAYDPTSPLANAQGMVLQPEIDPIAEISNQLEGSQAFAASLKALEVADGTDKTLLDLKT